MFPAANKLLGLQKRRTYAITFVIYPLFTLSNPATDPVRPSGQSRLNQLTGVSPMMNLHVVRRSGEGRNPETHTSLQRSPLC